MTATGHALLGIIIAAKFTNPLVAIPLAVASHIVGDILPHWDAGTHRSDKSSTELFREAVLDVGVSVLVVALALMYFPSKLNPWYTILIVLASQGLDWITAPYLFFNLKKPPFTWFYRFQSLINNPLDKPWGILTQIVFIVLFYLIVNPF